MDLIVFLTLISTTTNTQINFPDKNVAQGRALSSFNLPIERASPLSNSLNTVYFPCTCILCNAIFCNVIISSSFLVCFLFC